MIKINNFFTSGHHFSQDKREVKSKFQMLNNALLLSSLALIYAIINNFFRETYGIIPVELGLIFANIGLFFLLRKSESSFAFVSKVITTQYSLLFLYLFYAYPVQDLKFIWLFTYPIILLYFENVKNGFYWLAFMIAMLFVSVFQPFVQTYYSLFQISYLSFVLIVVSAIIYFYKQKMDEVRNLIIRQQDRLQNFNSELAKKVEEKTHELQELNDSLEIKVQEKITELIAKDKLLSVQSKQAVMGEMISMIAHQWRQPLSTVTLQISNLQIQKLLGGSIEPEVIDKTLDDISKSIIYLAETIDDFQTYFHPDKEKSKIGINSFLDKAINFIAPRLKEVEVQVVFEKKEEIIIDTFANELMQVILNLLNNAIDAFSEVKSEKHKLTINVENLKEKLCIYVIDNAGGIEDEHITHIFEPYFSTKGKNGTGLGLYMSQMIIEKQFEGTIEVDSSTQGSTFCISIPKSLS